MNSTVAANTSSMNVNGLSRIVPSKAEGVAWCTALTFSFVFLVLCSVSFDRNSAALMHQYAMRDSVHDNFLTTFLLRLEFF